MQPNPNMVITDSRVIAIGSTITGSLLSVNQTATYSDVNSDGFPDTATFDFGDLTNAPGASLDELVVSITVYPQDIAANINGNNLTTWAYFNDSQRGYSASSTFTLVEPLLAVTLSQNVSTADAGDIVLYTIRANHISSSTSAAEFLKITKTLEPHLQLVPGSLSSNFGSVNATDASSFEATFTTLNVGNSWVITYSVVVLSTAVSSSTLTETASISWQSSTCEPGRNYTASANSSFTLRGASFSFAEVDSCVPETVSTSVAVDETVTYDSVLYLAEGTTTNARVVVALPKSSAGYLEAVNATVIFGAQVNGSYSIVLNDTNNDGVDDTIIVTFGPLLDTPDNINNTEDTVTVRSIVVPIDNPANTRGKVLNTTSQFSYLGGTVLAWQSMTLVEPTLNMSMAINTNSADAGDILNYTLIIQHTSVSNSAALLITMSKTLQSDLQLVDGTLWSNIGVASQLNSTSFTVSLDSLPLGSILVVVYQAKVLISAVASSTISESSLVNWRSSSCNPGRNYNTSATISFAVKNATFSFVELTSCVPETTLPNVTVDETITYSSLIHLPEGTTTNATLSVTVPSNILGIVGLPQIQFATNILAPSTILLLDSDSDGVNDTVLITFGTITNQPDNIDNTNDDINVTTTLVVLDVPGNVRGKNIGFSSLFHYLGGNSNLSTQITVVEPTLNISFASSDSIIEAGDIVNYTITIQHATVSNSAGLFLAVSKTLESHLLLVNGSVWTNLGVVNDAAFNSIDITDPVLALGDTLLIKYQAIVQQTVVDSTTITDNVSLEYQSSSCNPGRMYSANATTSSVVASPDLSIVINDTCDPLTGTETRKNFNLLDFSGSRCSYNGSYNL
jgi:hypothetical protein